MVLYLQLFRATGKLETIRGEITGNRRVLGNVAHRERFLLSSIIQRTSNDTGLRLFFQENNRICELRNTRHVKDPATVTSI
jgi:hypothetical protein